MNQAAIVRLRRNRSSSTTSRFAAHTTTLSNGYVYFDKLVNIELTEPRLPAPEELSEEESPSVLLGQFLGDYLKKRTDLKPATMLIYRQIESNLTDYFTPKKSLEEITEGDVVDFGRWMHTKKYSRTTIDRR